MINLVTKSLRSDITTTVGKVVLYNIISLTIIFALVYSFSSIGKENSPESSQYYSETIDTPFGDKVVYSCIANYDNCTYMVFANSEGDIFQLLPLSQDCVPLSILKYHSLPKIVDPKVDIKVFE